MRGGPFSTHLLNRRGLQSHSEGRKALKKALWKCICGSMSTFSSLFGAKPQDFDDISHVKGSEPLL